MLSAWGTLYNFLDLVLLLNHIGWAGNASCVCIRDDQTFSKILTGKITINEKQAFPDFFFSCE